MDSLPSERIAELISAECHVEPKNFFMLVTPGKSLAGATQIAARAIEDVTFTMWEALHYDVRKVKHALSVAPIVPVCTSTVTTKALPDDFLGYGGRVFIAVEAEDEDLQKLAEDLVFESTPIYGKTFNEILKEADFDFKKVPGYPGIFRPAQIIINDMKTGEVYKAGKVNSEMIKKCLGLKT
jgi:methenyltetrahydromethanopterin cyclohydrolase